MNNSNLKTDSLKVKINENHLKNIKEENLQELKKAGILSKRQADSLINVLKQFNANYEYMDFDYS